MLSVAPKVQESNCTLLGAATSAFKYKVCDTRLAQPCIHLVLVPVKYSCINSLIKMYCTIHFKHPHVSGQRLYFHFYSRDMNHCE